MIQIVVIVKEMKDVKKNKLFIFRLINLCGILRGRGVFLQKFCRMVNVLDVN